MSNIIKGVVSKVEHLYFDTGNKEETTIKKKTILTINDVDYYTHKNIEAKTGDALLFREESGQIIELGYDEIKRKLSKDRAYQRHVDLRSTVADIACLFTGSVLIFTGMDYISTSAGFVILSCGLFCTAMKIAQRRMEKKSIENEKIKPLEEISKEESVTVSYDDINKLYKMNKLSR